jgi:TPR repeat protein
MRLGLAEYAGDRAARRSRVRDLMLAADGGDVEAQIALAWQYVRGEFLPRNLATAGTWLERAAASGEEEAAVQRARFLQLRHVPQGNRELRDFAARGNWKAQFWLGQHYEARRHRISRLKAVVWYDRSSGNGNLVAGAAKFMLLARLAPLRSKPIFAAAALREMAVMLRRLTPSRRRAGRYEALRYRLEPRW